MNEDSQLKVKNLMLRLSSSLPSTSPSSLNSTSGSSINRSSKLQYSTKYYNDSFENQVKQEKRKIELEYKKNETFLYFKNISRKRLKSDVHSVGANRNDNSSERINDIDTLDIEALAQPPGPHPKDNGLTLNSQQGQQSTYRPYDKEYITSIIQTYSDILNWSPRTNNSFGDFDYSSRRNSNIDYKSNNFSDGITIEANSALESAYSDLNPLKCALHGWQCEKNNRLVCVTCNASLVVKVPTFEEFSINNNNSSGSMVPALALASNTNNIPSTRGENSGENNSEKFFSNETNIEDYQQFVTELLKTYQRQLSSRHYQHCPWVKNSAKLEIYKITSANAVYELLALRKRLFNLIQAEEISNISRLVDLDIPDQSHSETFEREGFLGSVDALRDEDASTSDRKDDRDNWNKIEPLIEQWLQKQKGLQILATQKRPDKAIDFAAIFKIGLHGWDVRYTANQKHKFLYCHCCSRSVVLPSEVAKKKNGYQDNNKHHNECRKQNGNGNGGVEKLPLELVGEHQDWCCFKDNKEEGKKSQPLMKLVELIKADMLKYDGQLFNILRRKDLPV